MRTLFASERRCMSTLIKTKWGAELASSPAIISEHVGDPIARAKRTSFNCDFTIDFADQCGPWSHSAVAVASILPNALGAELFLTVEQTTCRPMRLELIGGGAFSIAHYAKYVDHVETVVREALRERGSDRDEVISAASIRNAAFARVMVVGHDATFLYCPNETVPRVGGMRQSLARRDEHVIDCYVDGDDIICFDGWIRTNVSRTETVLVAIPEMH